ncbi:MAG: Transcriptional regulator [Rhodobacteraceae bacterium HLUCCO18]|nr:MAG: Transcriptional regulator [Rhodobacteraceae bacterium HLUCCO18]
MKHLKIYTAIRLIQRQGSIRKAADLLAVSPSALNRSIQTFEDAVGFSIFERIPAGVRLTSAGELLLDVVERHLVEFGELQRQLGNLRDGHMGTLCVGIGDDISAGLPLLAMRDLETEMPGVSVNVSCGDVMRQLRQREIDLAIVTNPETDRSVEVLAAQNVRLAAFATPDWVGTGGQVGLWDLSPGRLVLPPEGTGSRTAISHAFRRHALEEGTVTSVVAAQLGQAIAHGPRTCIFPRTVFDGPGSPAALDPLELDIGSVQISVLRLSGVPLSRPSQCLLRSMESRLNAAT